MYRHGAPEVCDRDFTTLKDEWDTPISLRCSILAIDDCKEWLLPECSNAREIFGPRIYLSSGGALSQAWAASKTGDLGSLVPGAERPRENSKLPYGVILLGSKSSPQCGNATENLELGAFKWNQSFITSLSFFKIRE